MYGAIKRQQPFSGFTARRCFHDNDEDDMDMHGDAIYESQQKRSEKSIYEKTLNMLMTAGQAAFDMDSNVQMKNESEEQNVNNDNNNMCIERPSRTLEYYFAPKNSSHK